MPDFGTFIRTLSNGLTLVAEPMPGAHAAAWTLLVPAGSATEPENKSGLSNVLEGACYRGAGDRNARQLSDALDELGINRSGGAGVEYTTFGGATLGLYLPDALKLYADIVRRPHLAENEWGAERELALQALRGLDDNPRARLGVEVRRHFFVSAHARDPIGTRDGLQSLALEDLRADHARRFGPQGAILALAGGFDWPAIQNEVERIFGDWRDAFEAAPDARPVLPSAQATSRPLRLHIPLDKAQQHLAVVYPTVAPESSWNYVYRLAMAILSGGMGARLFTEVREKRGLVYSVSASANAHRGFGYTLASASTTPERADETLEVVVGELRRMKEGVSEDELERARTKLLTGLVMGEESSRARAAGLARDWWLLGRVRSQQEIRREIGNVTARAVAAFYEAHPVENVSVVTLGPRELETRSLS